MNILTNIELCVKICVWILRQKVKIIASYNYLTYKDKDGILYIASAEVNSPSNNYTTGSPYLITDNQQAIFLKNNYNETKTKGTDKWERKKVLAIFFNGKLKDE